MNIYKEKARDAINEPHSSYLRRKRNYKMIIEEGDVVREISGTHIEIIDSDKRELLGMKVFKKCCSYLVFFQKSHQVCQ